MVARLTWILGLVGCLCSMTNSAAAAARPDRFPFQSGVQPPTGTDPGTRPIRLKSGTFWPQAMSGLPKVQTLTKTTQPARRHVVIQFIALPNEHQRLQLTARGITLLDYLPENAFFASVPSLTQAAQLREAGVDWLGPVYAEDKLPTRVPTSGVGQWALRGDQTVELRVRYFADVPADFGVQALEKLGAAVSRLDALTCQFTVLLPIARLWDLAAADWVRWVEEIPPPPMPLNDSSRANAQADAVQESPYSLSGAGVVVGEWDSGAADPNHSDFGGRLTPAEANMPISVHATHVAGTLAGDGGQSEAQGGTARQWRGMAPGTRIICYSYDDPVPKYQGAINDYGIVVSQNSWGHVISAFFGSCGLLGDYSNLAPESDQIVAGQYGRPINVVFACGNLREGQMTNSCGVGPYRTIGPPATAKNILAVGAINSDDSTMTSFSSWGPLDDGRLKPDLVAPGAQMTDDGGVTSTIPANGYGVSRGTSMAAPVVSGAIALLVEDHRAHYSGQDPLPSTVKALLLHTAADLDDETPWYNKGPDFASGYGRLQIKEAVDQLRNNGVLVGRVNHGETNTYTLAVPEGAGQVKVTLVWDDPAAAENAAIALVNDLDLIVLDPNQTRAYPWTLDPANPAADAVQTQEDHLNVVEQVSVDAGVSPGDWTIQVVGRNVPIHSPQKFSLAFTPATIPLPSLLAIAHTSFNDSPGAEANGDGVIDPGEIIFADVVVRNTDGPSATNITATLTCLTPGVTVLQATSLYPDLLPGATATNATPFALHVAKSVPCGTSLAFVQTVLASGMPLNNSFQFVVGRFGLTNRLSTSVTSSDVPQAIPDSGSVASALSVPVDSLIADVDVSVRIDHTWTGDIQLDLEHPDGTQVRLRKATTDSGDNFGIGGCEAVETHTIFDDQASAPIATATAPFSGRYQPQSPLSVLNGKGRTGDWRLRVTDASAEDTGTLLCWGLALVSEQYGYSCNVFNRPPTAANQDLTVIHGAATDIILSGSDEDDEPLTFAILSPPTHGTLTGFDATTGRCTYTPETGYSGPDSLSFSVNDGTTNSPPAAVNLTVREPAADLAIVLTAPAEPVLVGSELTYQLVVSNRGPNVATDVAMTDPLPDGLEFVSATSDKGSCAFVSGAVTGELGSLEAGATATISIVVRAMVVGVVTHTASVSAREIDDDPTNNAASTSVTAKLDADLALIKVASIEPALFGVAFRYDILVTNLGPNTATGVRLVDPLPASLPLVSAETTQGTWTNQDGALVGELGDLASGASASVAIVVMPNSLGPVTNQAVVFADQLDARTADNTATTITTVIPHAELAISQSSTPEPAVLDHDLHYVITVSQSGPNVATGVRITDTLPGGVSFVSTELSQGTCSQENDRLIFELGQLASGSEAAVTVVVRPTQLGLITNAVTVTANETDLDPANNSASGITEVKLLADLTVAASADPSPVLAGNSLTYSLLVTNLGPSATASLWLTNYLPDTVTFVAAELTQGTWANLNGVVVCELGELASGSNALVTLVVTPTQPGPLTNVTAVGGEASDPDLTSNTFTNVTFARLAADVAVAMSVSPEPVIVGENLTCSITVSNNGPFAATGVRLEHPLPPGVDFISAAAGQGTYANQDGVVRFEVGELAAGASATATLVVSPSETGLVTNTVSASAEEVDLVPENNTAAVVTSAIRIADLSLSRTDPPATGLIGSPFLLKLSVTNQGPHTARRVLVTDALPGELSFVSAEASQGVAEAVDHTFTCNLGELPGGASATITLTLLPTTLGTITNSATVASQEVDPNPADNEASWEIVIQPSANLAVATTVLPDPAALGHELVYVSMVTNLGPSTATALVLHQTMSDSLALVSAESTLGTCTNVNGQITCEIPELPAGSNAAVRVVVIPGQLGTVTNTVLVAALEPDLAPDNNSTTAVTAVKIDTDLAVTLVLPPDPVLTGKPLTYAITVTNFGPNPATSVVLTDLLPGGVNLLSAESSRGTWTQESEVLTCALGELAVGEGASFTVIAVPAGRGLITNRVNVRGDEADLFLANNTAEAASTVNNIADLTLGLTSPAGPIVLDTPIVYALAVTNLGPHPATQVLLTDLLPDGATFVSAESSQGTYSAEGNTVRFDLGSLEPAAFATASFTLIPNTATILTNSASASGSELDPDPSNNSAATTTEVRPQANLVLSLSGSPDPVLVGSNLVYCLTVTNLGPHPATSVVVTDELSTATELVAAETTQGTTSLENGIVRWAAGELPVGGGLALTITTRPLAPGVITNAATASANELERDPADNSASVLTRAKVDADLSLTKTTSPSLVLVGQPLVSLLTVTNHGPNLATVLTLTEQLPDSVSLVSAEPSQGTCRTLGNTIICELGSLEVGSNATLVVTVIPALSGVITNAANIVADEIDPNPANNEAVAAVLVQPLADLLVTQTAAPDPILVDNSLRFTITIANHAPYAVPGVTLTDVLPDNNVSVVSVAPSQGRVAQSSGVLLCELGDLAQDALATVELVLIPHAVGRISNQATAASLAADPANPNLTSIAKVTVVETPTLTLDKSGNKMTIAWARSASAFVLESTENLGDPASWSPVANPLITITDDQIIVTVKPTGTVRFYRLKKG